MPATPVIVPDLLPTDAQERVRLDFQSYVLRAALHSNTLAPVRDPESVLDVGCGSGRWALEIAQTYPASYVLGVDLVPPSLDDMTDRPHNLTFAQVNLFDGLPFSDGVFGYVHQRLLYLALPITAWPEVIGELARITSSGGWVEIVEGDLARSGGPALELAMGWLLQLGAQRGIDPRMGSQSGRLLREQGLRNLVVREVELPIGVYGGRIGNMMAANFFALLDALRKPLLASGVTNAQTFERALVEMRYEMTRWRYTQPLYIAYGQR